MKNPVRVKKTDFSKCVTLCARSVYPITGAYDSTADYWKVMKNGDIFDDGRDGEISFEDGRETIYTKDKRKQGSLEEYLQASNRSLNGTLDAAGFVYEDGKGWTSAGKTISASAISSLMDSGVVTNTAYAGNSKKGFLGGIQNGWDSAINAGKGLLNTIGNKTTSFMSGLQIGNRIRNSVRVEGDSLDFWNSMMSPEVMAQYDKDKNQQGPQCNNFLADSIKTQFGNDMYAKIFPDGVTSANVLFEQFAVNPNLEVIDTNKFSMSQIQAMADKGALIIMAFKNPDANDSGHVAFVANSGVGMMSSPTSYNGNPLPQSGFGYNQSISSAYPIFAQAGVVTGNVTAGWGVIGWNRQNEYKYQGTTYSSYREYLLKNNVNFYTVRRR